MIKLLLLDVDGTLTDGSLYFDENFHEMKAFNVKDGLGMTLWQKLGKKNRYHYRKNFNNGQKTHGEFGRSVCFYGR